MKIALIHYRMIYKGGLETRLLNYIAEFTRLGHEVTVICSKYDSKIILPGGVRIQRLILGIIPKPFRKLAFSNKVRNFLSKNNFDFSLSLGRTVGQDAVLAAANHKGYLKAMGLSSFGLSNFLQNYLDQKSFNSSKVIFAASQMMADEIHEYYNIPYGKITILHPPLNLAKFNKAMGPDKLQARTQLELAPDKLIFLFVSTSHQRKGFELLNSIFSKLDDSKYQLLAAGDKIPLEVPDNIKYVGYLKDPSIYYAAADFTIHPAKFEPFGQIVSESLACGTPVIVSHMVGAKEIIGKKEGLVIASFDVEQWVDVIRELDVNAFKIQEEKFLNRELGLEQHVEKMLERLLGE